MARLAGKDRGITQRKGREGWWVRLYMDGRERWFRCDTKSQAKALYGRLKGEQREGKYFEKTKAVPFREIAQEYLLVLDARRKRKGDDHARMSRWILAFGDQDAATITARQIESVLTALQGQGRKPATLMRHLTVLKATFNRAKRLGLLRDNPATLVKTAKPNNVLVRYLTPDQEAALLKHLPPRYHAIVITAMHTGLRQGELLRLAWADVDWNMGVLTVNETKAGEGKRLPMNSTVVGLLSTLKQTYAPSPLHRVFPHDGRYLRRAFARAVKAAGLAPFRFHDLRHTFASRLAMRGANDRTLMALGGWKSPAMLSRYAHLSPTHLWEAVEGLTQAGTVTKTVTTSEEKEEDLRNRLKKLERERGFEPPTLALARRCSTTELFPLAPGEDRRFYPWL
jgi:integrase